MEKSSIFYGFKFDILTLHHMSFKNVGNSFENNSIEWSLLDKKGSKPPFSSILARVPGVHKPISRIPKPGKTKLSVLVSLKLFKIEGGFFFLVLDCILFICNLI